MADPVTRSVAPEDGTTITSAGYGEGPPKQDFALPDRLRVAGPFDLFATPRARDGTGLLEQSGLGVRGLPGRPERTS